ncbi:hypothetical protein K2173_016688 [Erythroxylum novogranatense]|uniref:Peptidase M16 middle/third domain-containing protein n=1 Tax=Erythroxylum novogranatense TaxID=1862640 RepID=A0AAV8SGY2_9ROSI|nr:hypothetical protein K2173_016688 [Erythroxylum novogranatense]
MLLKVRRQKAAVCVVMGRFSDPVEAQGLAHCLVNLLLYPAEHVVYRDCMYRVWDEDLLKGFLDFFTPENMRFDVVSKSFTHSKGICLTFLKRKQKS